MFFAVKHWRNRRDERKDGGNLHTRQQKNTQV